MSEAAKPKRSRRGGAEIRALMLEAARTCFAESGYASATTRQIAARAGVAEPLLFRHFSNKQLLFEAAVLEPLDGFLASFTAEWAGPALGDDEPAVLLERFVTGVYDLCREHRELLLAFPMDELGRPVPQAAFARLERMAVEVADRFGLGYDVAVAVRAAVLTVATMALFGEHLFPAGADVDRGRIVTELSGLLTSGLTRPRPAAAGRLRRRRGTPSG